MSGHPGRQGVGEFFDGGVEVVLLVVIDGELEGIGGIGFADDLTDVADVGVALEADESFDDGSDRDGDGSAATADGGEFEAVTDVGVQRTCRRGDENLISGLTAFPVRFRFPCKSNIAKFETQGILHRGCFQFRRSCGEILVGHLPVGADDPKQE